MKKKIIAIATVALFATFLSSFAGNLNGTTLLNTPRYLMFSGKYETKEITHNAMFKLDTYTGDVWMLKGKFNGKKEVIRWVPVKTAKKAKKHSQENNTKNLIRKI